MKWIVDGVLSVTGWLILYHVTGIYWLSPDGLALFIAGILLRLGGVVICGKDPA